MNKLHIAAAERSPLVDFDFDSGLLVIKGESYPEDASRIFGPIFAALDQNLPVMKGRGVRCDIELIYFNSSSAKALMNMFKVLDTAAASGTPVEINWRFSADDETMREFGDDFREDLNSLTFKLVEVEDN